MIPFWFYVATVVIVGVTVYFAGWYDAKYTFTEKDKK